ncbi:MAG: L-threonylcarbamoyladenylate synthase [Candidatus Aenigmarchaeota archaeon]|nr:L-threonylcarbamoyladenylate synthase [Candidatus Aenigmarchaeota archaeon]
MKDEILINKALRVLKTGGVIIYPTETVYGLGADATNHSAVNRIFEIKKDKFTPILVAVSSVEMAKKYVWWNKYADALAKKYLPGPLSLLLSLRDKSIDERIYQGGIKIGIRIPKNEFVLELLRNFGKPITSTSASLPGKKHPTRVEEIDEEVKRKVDLVIDKGECEFKLPSTIVDISSYPPKLIREGVIKFEEIMKVVEGV